ncbi:hypothetical protein J1N35_024701 [Gossypium stocksii]|uniref:Retrotransposon Copia-like N-terminal domain-containing protein n=1 Tax=Gossypium stocksii TaxID=47602 RepID=A0A9D3V7V1_9ROSI|nr:hypothetical protein J1N35_024701 [Gossypium stocksii]
MATSASICSSTTTHGCLSFTGTQLVQSFPRHDTIKLDDSNFIQWQQHIRLISEGYNLTSFLEGTLPAPPRFLPSPDGSLVSNPDTSSYFQQDKLLTSWLLSTISSSLLSCFTDVKTACDIWTTVTRLFAAVIGAKISHVHHELHLTEKGDLLIKEYIVKIQNKCSLLDAFRSRIFETEKVEIVLVGLPWEFDVVLTLASFSSEPLPFQHLVDVLLEYESHQARAVQEICGRFGHLAHPCYYHFNSDYGGPVLVARPLSSSTFTNPVATLLHFSQPGADSLQHFVPYDNRAGHDFGPSGYDFGPSGRLAAVGPILDSPSLGPSAAGLSAASHNEHHLGIQISGLRITFIEKPLL